MSVSIPVDNCGNAASTAASANGRCLSRREFVSGLIGAAGILGLPAATAMDASATVLLSPQHRAFALAHAGEKYGLVQVLETQATAVIGTPGRQFTLQLGPQQALRNVGAAWMASATELLVLDAHAYRLHRYALDGTPLGWSRIEGHSLPAAGGCADGSGGCYLSLPGDHQIARLSRSGELLQRFGQLGTAPGRLNYPTAIARQADGSLVIANTGNRRIDRYSAAGEFAGTLAQFEFMPRHLAISDQTLAVYDSHASRIAMLSLRTGVPMDSIALTASRTGPIQCRALTAAGGQRFLVSV